MATQSFRFAFRNVEKLFFNHNSKSFHSNCRYANIYCSRQECTSTNFLCFISPNINYVNYRAFSISNLLLKKEKVSLTFIKGDGQEVTAVGKEGESILDFVVNNNIDVEGYGACEGTLSCSTCHVIFKREEFNKLSERASDEELDMLDLAPGVQGTSRLGCQVTVSKMMEGITVQIPGDVIDAREMSNVAKT